MEKRQNNRYRLAATVSYTWETTDHHVHHGNGRTRDCSLSGVFVVTADKLPVGSILRMKFTLPPLLAAGHGAQIETSGHVVRCETDGFAAVADLGPSSLLHREASEPILRART